MIHFGKYPVVSNRYPIVSPHQAQQLLLIMTKLGVAYRTGQVRLAEALPIEIDAELRGMLSDLARFAEAAAANGG